MLRLVGSDGYVYGQDFRVRRVAPASGEGIITGSSLLKLRLEVILDIVGRSRSCDCMMLLKRGCLLLRQKLGRTGASSCTTSAFDSTRSMIVSRGTLLVLLLFALLARLRRSATMAAGTITVVTLLVVFVGGLTCGLAPRCIGVVLQNYEHVIVLARM